MLYILSFSLLLLTSATLGQEPAVDSLDLVDLGSDNGTDAAVNLTSSLEGVGKLNSNLGFLFGSTTELPVTIESTTTTEASTTTSTTTTIIEETTAPPEETTASTTTTTNTPTAIITTIRVTAAPATTAKPTSASITTAKSTAAPRPTVTTAPAITKCPGQDGEVRLANTTIPQTITWRFNSLKSHAYYGVKYGTAKRFSASSVNLDFSYYSQPDRPKKGFQCPQTGGSANRTAEECLYLDIYVPPGPLNNAKVPCQKFPVLFFIHGGAYRTGSKDLYPSANLSNVIQSVIVIPNYRLGVLGFLSTQDGAASGNWGLSDLKLALAWTQGVIDQFGGDPKSITIVGQNTGAALASMMMLDPDNRAAIHGVVAMSGSSLAPWAFTPNALAAATDLAKLLQCPVDSTDSMITCIQKQDANDILSAADKVDETGTYFIPFAPVIDKILVKDDPKNILQKGAWKFPGGFTTGFLARDASVLMSAEQLWKERRTNSMENWFPPIHFPESVHTLYHCTSPPTDIVKAMYDFYQLSGSTGPLDTRRKLIELVTHMLFVAPAVKEATLYASDALADKGVILYNISYNKFGLKQLPNAPVKSLGAFHTLDLTYLFGQKLSSDLWVNTTVSYAEVSSQVRNLIHNAVQFGLSANTAYSFTPQTGSYLALEGPDGWKLAASDFSALLNFWDHVASLGC